MDAELTVAARTHTHSYLDRVTRAHNSPPTGVPADHPTNSASFYESSLVQVMVLSVLSRCSKENLNSIPALANNPIRKQIVDAFFDKRCVFSRHICSVKQGENITFCRLCLLVCTFVSFLFVLFFIYIYWSCTYVIIYYKSSNFDLNNSLTGIVFIKNVFQNRNQHQNEVGSFQEISFEQFLMVMSHFRPPTLKTTEEEKEALRKEKLHCEKLPCLTLL